MGNTLRQLMPTLIVEYGLRPNILGISETWGGAPGYDAEGRWPKKSHESRICTHGWHELARVNSWECELNCVGSGCLYLAG
jgi:hypothetical protein